MAALQQGTIHIKEKSATQANADQGWLRVYAKTDGSIYRKDENGVEYRFIGNIETQAISAGLNTQVSQISGYTQSNTNSINTLFSTYANSTTVANISAGLDSRIDSKQDTLISGVNIKTINGQSLLGSGDYTIAGGGGNSWVPLASSGMTITAPTTANFIFSVTDYISKTTVAAISAGLNTRLSANESIDTTQTNSINTLFSTYANSTTVANISAGLNTRLSANESLDTTQTNSINTLFSTYANSTTVAAISAGLNTRIVDLDSRLTNNESLDTTQTNSINTLFSTYANSTTVAAISGGLNTRLSSNESLDTTQTNSINTLFSTYANSTTVAAISGGLNTRLSSNESLDTTQTNSINTLFSTYANSTTVANISAGLNTRLSANESLDTTQTNSINTLFSTYANSTTVAAISGGLNTRIGSIEGNYVTTNTQQTIPAIKTFGSDVTINGNLYVNGDKFIVNTQQVSAADNIIVINANEVGNGVTAGYAGIQVNRGIATPYWFVFEEARNAFTVGVTGQTQVVATREDNPLSSGLAIWNDSLKRFDTIPNTTYSNSTTVSAISAGLDTRIGYNNNSINTLFSTYANSTTEIGRAHV
jgi:hypothetical protein